MADSAAWALAYLERLGVTGEASRQLLVGLPETGPLAVAWLQARLAQAESAGDPELTEPDCAWLQGSVRRAYGVPAPAPQRALMPVLLPLRRQHMTARTLQRGFFRQLLGLFVYRPAARVLRRLQLLTGRVERP